MTEEKEENLLNKSPKVYRVQRKIKAIFFISFFLGIFIYCFMMIEKRAKIISYLDKSDQELALKSFKGNYVLLNFMATYCPACLSEMPSLDDLQENFSGKLIVLGLACDDDHSAVLKYIDEKKPKIKILWDRSGKLKKRFLVSAFPETFLLDKNGHIIEHFYGPKDFSSPAFLAYFSQIFGQ